jgi:hypothetical protein
MSDESSGPSRRAFLAAGATAASVGLAGCAGLTGDLAFEAGSATVTAQARAETGYREAGVTAIPYTREVGLGPIRRTVEVTNLLAEYDRSVGLDSGGLTDSLGLPTDARAAVFAAFTTPAVDVFGRTLNPVGNLSTDELASLIQQHYGGFRNLAVDAELSGTVLGQSTGVTRYTAEADLLTTAVVSTDVPIYLYVGAPVRADEDFVLTIAAHPRAAGPREGTVRTLLEGVEHAAGEGA